jgi:hypothetical protein
MAKTAYMDEAGISEHEPVSVVLSVIVDVDAQWRLAEAEIIESFKTIPRAVLESRFVFSAKVVIGGKYRPLWPDEDRIAFLVRMMSIPRKLGLPICVGFQRRGKQSDPTLLRTPPQLANLKHWEMDHVSAFMECAMEIEDFMKAHTPPNEVCTIKAEQTRLNRFMYKVLKFLQRSALPGANVPVIHRIPEPVNWLDKDDSPLLWLADSCAFAFRSFLAESAGPHTDKFIEAVVGYPLAFEGRWTLDTAGDTIRFG